MQRQAGAVRLFLRFFGLGVLVCDAGMTQNLPSLTKLTSLTLHND
jgi:hypothetical protein